MSACSGCGRSDDEITVHGHRSGCLTAAKGPHPMTPEERKRLRELCEKATPGPWKPVTKMHKSVPKDKGCVSLYGPDCLIYSTPLEPGCLRITHDRQKADCRFIAAAREAVPALLDALEASEADVAELRALDAEAQVGADEQTKQLRVLQSENTLLLNSLGAAERENERLRAALQSENAALRERLEEIERLTAKYADMESAAVQAEIAAQAKALSLEQENAALRERLAKIETAAGRLISAKERLTLNEDHWAALRAALEKGDGNEKA